MSSGAPAFGVAAGFAPTRLSIRRSDESHVVKLTTAGRSWSITKKGCDMAPVRTLEKVGLSERRCARKPRGEEPPDREPKHGEDDGAGD